MPPHPECVIFRISDYRRPKAAGPTSRRARKAVRHYIAQLPDGQIVIRTFPDDADQVRQLLDACNRLSAQLIKLLPDDC